MAQKRIHLKILTPTKTFYNKEIYSVLLHSTEGEMVVRPGHIALTCSLRCGVIKIKTGTDEGDLLASIMDGFVEITPTQITLLTDAAEWGDEIDVERAKQAHARALANLKDELMDRERACRSMERAEIRLKLGLLKK